MVPWWEVEVATHSGENGDASALAQPQLAPRRLDKTVILAKDYSDNGIHAHGATESPPPVQ